MCFCRLEWGCKCQDSGNNTYRSDYQLNCILLALNNQGTSKIILVPFQSVLAMIVLWLPSLVPHTWWFRPGKWNVVLFYQKQFTYNCIDAQTWHLKLHPDLDRGREHHVLLFQRQRKLPRALRSQPGPLSALQHGLTGIPWRLTSL